MTTVGAYDSEEGQRGRITVGTLQSLAGGFLAEAILQFHDTHPQVDFFVRTGHSEQVVEMLYDGLVKLGLTRPLLPTTDYSLDSFLVLWHDTDRFKAYQ